MEGLEEIPKKSFDKCKASMQIRDANLFKLLIGIPILAKDDLRI
jgi:hypothetical protein